MFYSILFCITNTLKKRNKYCGAKINNIETHNAQEEALSDELFNK